MLSLNARLLTAASVVLVAFLGLAGLTLDRAFRDSALAAVRDRLQAQVYMLLGAAELSTARRLILPEALPEARFSTPGSGLYARVLNGDGQIVWRSPSLLGMTLPFPPPPEVGEFDFREVAAPRAPSLFTISFTVSWEIAPDAYRRHTFQVAESRRAFNAQVAGFRRSLWGWLLASALVLLLAQGIILRWSLKPLRQVAREVTEIEAGHRSELTETYPKELRALTGNLNDLIRQSRSHLERYRNALGDLAHSLKTPLAVLHGAVENDMKETDMRQTVREQVVRMNQTVEYQLQRAAASGRIALAAPVPVAAVARKMLDALAKVYADKALQLAVEVEDGAAFYGEEGDLMEILGNLADNACKWARQRVVVQAASRDHGELVLAVEDDGPGIPPERRQAIPGRGERADPAVAGHGIGLAVVRDIVKEVYQGDLEIDQGPLGGARVRVRVRFS